MLRKTILVFAALVVLASATVVDQCDSETSFKDTGQVSISGCDKPKCSLKRGTTVVVEIKFVPKRDFQTLINDVSALLFNVPVPFVGVDGTNACDNIYNADGSKASCPLNQGKEYLYKNSFDVMMSYPKIQLNILYALREGNDRVICFEIPAKITK